ncbi:type IA DNA topoisomerase [Paenibacillus hubeiensis]|uniref:type IA DNA topoisomerase n=1 Tax=Paenibacillus hubeiensis TaxID=3077330 RepID=UPI0031B9C99F
MYNRVIIAEKPDMGANIAAALGISAKKRGYIELTSGDVVTWGIGHLIQEKMPDQYPEFKEWTWESLPIIPEQMETVVDPKKKDQFDVVKRLLFASKECILATDPDREGEYIGRLILHQCGYQRKFKRLWIDDLTESTIQKGMQNLGDSDDYVLLGQAAQTRSYADYWLGFTASRFFSLVGNAKLSAGRVQTPTLRLVYDREMDMENFVPKPFYTLQARIHTAAGDFEGAWFKQTEGQKINRLNDHNQAEELQKKVQGQSGSIRSYQSKSVKRNAPQLLNSSALKSEARKQLGYSTVQTTKYLQSLYDQSFVSYPRGNSRHLSTNKADELAKHLVEIQSEYSSWYPAEIQSLKGNPRFVDDKKAATHHAIVPTAKKVGNENLSPEELKLYELILKHTLAAFHPAGEDLETEIITEIAGETFISKAIEIRVPGWRALLKPNEESSEDEEGPKVLSRLPVVENGQAASAQSAQIGTGKTSKPKRLNDDELEKLMENAGQYVDDSADEGVLEQLRLRGIGTPATRTNIVQKLVQQEYIEIKKNLVYLTPKGRSFMQLIHDHPIASVELTGEFEMKLALVEEGEVAAEVLQEEFKEYTRGILASKEMLMQRVKESSSFNFENVEEVGRCPRCQNALVERQKAYSCSAGKECGFVIWKEFRGIKIKKKQVQELIQGHEVLLKDLPGKEEGKSYDLYVKLLPDGKLDTRYPTAEDQSLGTCPKCGKPVTEGNKTYGCSGWKEGCDFKIWKTFRKVDLPPPSIKSLLAGKKVLVKNFQSEKGTYDLILYMEGHELKNRFPLPEELSLGKCPLCSSHVVEKKGTYQCSGTACRFRLMKEFLGQTIKPAQMKKLLKSGSTDLIEGLKGGKTGSFDTKLGYDQTNNRYSFVK